MQNQAVLEPLRSLDVGFIEGFYQAAEPWRLMRLRHGRYTLQQKGCLLSALASGLNWAQVRLPPTPAVRQAVRTLIAEEVAGDRDHAPVPGLQSIDLDGPMNPGLFNAWMSINNAQGFRPGWLDLDMHQVCGVLSLSGGFQWIPYVHYERSLPDSRQLWTWLSVLNILIAHLDPASTAHGNHWVLITGYDATTRRFICWDPGYPPGNEHHTSDLAIGEFNRLHRLDRRFVSASPSR
ncbi:MAG TPA: hypothetical protein VJR58_22480 [Vineibacter sp.]|nr:hypothetical protein [Vineibacter sp.]